MTRKGLALVRALVVVAMCGFARHGHAAIDVAGGWDVDLPLVPSPAVTWRMMVKHMGDALVVRLEHSGLGGGAEMAGTFDPETRAFHAEDVAAAPGDCAARIDAVVSPDGDTMAGSVTYIVGVFTSHCVLSTTALTATRTACGNGIVDAGESCDPGDIFALDDCCSRICADEAANTPCTSPEKQALSCLPDSTCTGSGTLCGPPGLSDGDGDGIPDSCDSCSGGLRVSMMRSHIGRKFASIVVRADLPSEDIDPVASGLVIASYGASADSLVLAAGAATPYVGGWTVRRAGVLWRYHQPLGRVTGTVRAARGHLRVQVSALHSSAPTLASERRFVTVRLPSSSSTCADIDLGSRSCVVHKHTTVCR